MRCQYGARTLIAATVLVMRLFLRAAVLVQVDMLSRIAQGRHASGELCSWREDRYLGILWRASSAGAFHVSGSLTPGFLWRRTGEASLVDVSAGGDGTVACRLFAAKLGGMNAMIRSVAVLTRTTC